MSRLLLPTLNINHFISSDAPLSSPISDAAPWDHHSLADPFPLAYAHHPLPPSPPYSGPDSPVLASRMLKSRLTPEDSEPELCLPTHQVFNDFPTVMCSPSPESSTVSLPPDPPRLSISFNTSVVPSKRPSSTATTSSKKARASGERITTKDFVPPDVSGLSKREARLVKNRAAAFLSRQRKREEFESMEVRVVELEQENARLLALTQNVAVAQQEEIQEALQSEVEQLRSQLAAIQRRERELAAQLSHKASPRASSVKMETSEPHLHASRSAAVQAHKGEKSGASLGLMVLLCALPTLLSMPRVSTVPTITFPLPGSSSVSNPFEMQNYMPGEYDWMASASRGSSVMDVDLDFDDKGRISTVAPAPAVSAARKLEFVDMDSEALGLSGLDISFDASPSENGKVRVRIHPQASVSSESLVSLSDAEDQPMHGISDASSLSSAFASVKREMDDLGPFLGVGAEYGSGFGPMTPDEDGLSSSRFTSLFDSSSGSRFDFEYGSSTSGLSREGSPVTGRRRVRIALKSMPGAGKEGGEWEVEMC